MQELIGQTFAENLDDIRELAFSGRIRSFDRETVQSLRIQTSHDAWIISAAGIRFVSVYIVIGDADEELGILVSAVESFFPLKCNLVERDINHLQSSRCIWRTYTDW